MKYALEFFLSLFVCIAVLIGIASAEEPIRKIVNGKELDFEIIVEPKEKKVEVITKKINGDQKSPTMKLKFYSKDIETKPIKLHVLEAPQSHYPKYSGKLDHWNNSYIGFELLFSLDNKSWKKIRKDFEK